MLEFALNQVPFSCYGSYLSVSSVEQGVHEAPATAKHVYIRTHHGGGVSVLQLEVTLGRETLILEPRANASSVRFEHPQGFVELCFDGVDALRFRGSGLGLRLSAMLPTVAYVSEPKQRQL